MPHGPDEDELWDLVLDGVSPVRALAAIVLIAAAMVAVSKLI